MRYALSSCRIENDTIKGSCIFCGKEHEIKIANFEEKIKRYNNGELIQDVFPELTSDDRELCISGCCANCWDMIFTAIK